MVKPANMDRHGLMAALQTYPWFAAARAMLCVSMAGEAGMDSAAGLFRESLPYLPDAAYTYRQMRALHPASYTDSKLTEAEREKSRERTRIYIAGTDFFSKEEYESARSSEDSNISSIAIVDCSAPATELPARTQGDSFDLVSETLAQIYANQGYPERAKEIYLQLSLESPEKSAYFASLIDNLNS